MAEVDLRAGIYDGSSFEQLRLWGDDILLRVVDAGGGPGRGVPVGGPRGTAGPRPPLALAVAARHGLRLA